MTNYTGGMNQVLDTYQAVKELVSSGFAEEQAEAIVSLQVRFLNENVATKQDIALIQKDIETLRLDTKRDIAGVHKDIEIIHKDIESLKAETKKDIESLKAETKKDIESLRAETQQSFAAVHKDIEIIHKDIELLRAETQKSMQVLGSQLILKMGAMLVVAVGLLASLQTFAG